VLVHVVVEPVVEHEVEQVLARPVDAMNANNPPMHNSQNPLMRMLFPPRGKNLARYGTNLIAKYRSAARPVISAQFIPANQEIQSTTIVVIFPGYGVAPPKTNVINITLNRKSLEIWTGRMVFYSGAPGSGGKFKEGSRMSDSYVGEVRLVGFNFAPVGWALCNGQLLSISQYSTLYNLIGTIYGGDGVQTFGLPNLQGRTPVHQGSSGGGNYVIGQTGGLESVTLTISQYPIHNHALLGSSNNGSGNNPANNAVGSGLKVYINENPATAMNASMVGLNGGGNQPHDNRQPYQVLNWIISLYGVYPAQG
jgi:microcystin-dependent protein